MPKLTNSYFLDESGSSGDLARPGAAFDFNGQEIFTLACLGVEDTAGLEEELVRLAAEHRVRKQSFKSSTAWDKPELALGLINYVRDSGLSLMLEVVDKRFMISTNLINTTAFPVVGDCDCTPDALAIRNVLAAYVHANAPSAVFGSFLAACADPSAECIIETYGALFSWLANVREEDEVGKGLRYCVSDSHEFFMQLGPEKEGVRSRFLPLPDQGKKGQKVWMLPNLTSLTNIYARINLRHRGRIESITLFHDRQDHFDDILREAKSTAEELAAIGLGPRLPTADYRFTEQAQLRFIPSADAPGIRAADLLAGFAMRYARSVLYGRKSLDPVYHEVFEKVLDLDRPSEGLGTNLVLSPLDRLRLLSPSAPWRWGSWRSDEC
ncbi:DUF3800 domain-containing protein [Caenispirillum bisanense]|uniref:DUF3800 domain-containing protein n=1 Tax=Caenispirillum bisanense TaxID=414052 RepID=UPI0031DCD6B2